MRLPCLFVLLALTVEKDNRDTGDSNQEANNDEQEDVNM